MPSGHPQLSSIGTALEELTSRVTSIADHYATTPREDLAADLYDVERSLRSARRRLDRVIRDVGPG